MGRHKLHKTPEQIAEQKRRWADTRNERRRQQYADDSAHRRSIHTQNRAAYRKRANSEPRNCRENIAKLREFGFSRRVSLKGSMIRMLTFSVSELADALGGYHRIVLYRWHKERKFPRPIVQAKDQEVYTVDQAHKILTVMSEHQDKKLYLRKSDAETINQLFNAMRPNSR